MAEMRDWAEQKALKLIAEALFEHLKSQSTKPKQKEEKDTDEKRLPNNLRQS